MALPIAPGHPDFSSTGTSKLIPQIWSSKLVPKFYRTTVFGEITNTDYEGEIKKVGDKVIIRTVPDTTIRDYQKGQALVYDAYESANVELTIDFGKYWGFGCEDVDKAQADIDFVSKWSDDSSQRLKIAIDSHILNAVDADADSSNKGITAGAISAGYNLGTTGSAIALDKTNVLDYIVDCNSVLTEQDIPEQGRYIVIPGWMANLIKKSDLKDASLTGDGVSVLRNGKIGMIDNFTLYVSNNYTAVSDGGNSCYNVLFGHPGAITFAATLSKVENLRNPQGFGDLIRGLFVYGYETLVPKMLGVLYCRKA